MAGRAALAKRSAMALTLAWSSGGPSIGADAASAPTGARVAYLSGAISNTAGFLRPLFMNENASSIKAGTSEG